MLHFHMKTPFLKVIFFCFTLLSYFTAIEAQVHLTNQHQFPGTTYQKTNGKDLDNYEITRCHADDYLSERLLNDQEFAKNWDKWTKMESKVNRSMLACNTSNSVIVPVAVHYGADLDCSNMTCLIAAAERQIEVLNEAFSASDISGYNNLTNLCPAAYPASYAPSVGSGACIQFCLASQDHPSTSGLNDGEPAITVGQHTWQNTGGQWTDYMNIFVSDGIPEGLITPGSNSLILGISPVPGSANGDGFWVYERVFGGSGINCNGGGTNNINSFNSSGYTAVHEAGHYFGLLHTFDSNGNCTDADLNAPGPIDVTDTPAQSTASSGCPNVTGCGNADSQCTGAFTPFWNYMDYSGENCQFMFTETQCQVMNYWAQAQNYKSSAVACDPAAAFSFVGDCVNAAPTAAFAPTNAQTVCENGCILFTDESIDNPTTWQWNFTVISGDITLGTTTSTTENELVCITGGSSGTIEVTLTVSNSIGNNTITGNVPVNVDPNCADGCVFLTNVNTQTDTFTVYGGDTGGYISGSNAYNDESKAEYYDPADFGLCYGAKITAVDIYFGVVDAGVIGSIDVAIWDNSGTGGTPGNILGTQTIPDVSVLITNGFTTVDFSSSPITINGPFYVGITGLATQTSGGYIGIISNSIGESNPATAWEQWSDGSWHDIETAWNGVAISQVIWPTFLPVAPLPNFSLPANLCTGTNITFTDSTPTLCSSTLPTYSWTVTPVAGSTAISPNTSTAQNAVFNFPQMGTYDIELCVEGVTCEIACTTQTITVQDCTGGCPITLNIPDPLSPGTPVGSGYYNASDWVKSNAEVSAGSNVTYEAGNCVELISGFEVIQNGEFLANINPCAAPIPLVEVFDNSIKEASDQTRLKTTPFQTLQTEDAIIRMKQ